MTTLNLKAGMSTAEMAKLLLIWLPTKKDSTPRAILTELRDIARSIYPGTPYEPVPFRFTTSWITSQLIDAGMFWVREHDQLPREQFIVQVYEGACLYLWALPADPMPVPLTGAIDAQLFYVAKSGDYGINQRWTSTLSVCDWSFAHRDGPAGDAKAQAQLSRLCGESKAFGKANGLTIQLLPMIIMSNGWGPYNGQPYNGGLHLERLCFWFGIWRNDYMRPNGLAPFPIFSCGDSKDQTNDPANVNWRRMVADVAASIQGNIFGSKFETVFPDICAIWEAEKLGGVGTAQLAVDVCRQAFPHSRVWIHATKPEFAGVTADIIAIQGPVHPFKGDSLSDQTIRDHHEAFRQARRSANQKLMWFEWNVPDAQRVNAQRRLIRTLPDCIGTGC